MTDRIARFISSISNPIILLIPVPFLIVFYETKDLIYALKWSLLSLAFLFSIGIFVFIEVRRGVFSDLDVSRREQRPILFIITGLVIVLFFFAVYFFSGPKVLYVACFGILLGVFLLSAINTRIKASIHVATATVFFLTIGILYHLPFYFYFLLPVIAWSRIRLKRHTFSETLIGFLSGTSVIIFLYSVLKLIYHTNI